MGTSSRDDHMKRVQKENVPGPGNYSVKNDSDSRSFRFGNDKRAKHMDNGTPGPGQYRIPCTIVDVPRYNMNGTFDNRFRYI